MDEEERRIHQQPLNQVIHEDNQIRTMEILKPAEREGYQTGEYGRFEVVSKRKRDYAVEKALQRTGQ